METDHSVFAHILEEAPQASPPRICHRPYRVYSIDGHSRFRVADTLPSALYCHKRWLIANRSAWLFRRRASSPCLSSAPDNTRLSSIRKKAQTNGRQEGSRHSISDYVFGNPQQNRRNRACIRIQANHKRSRTHSTIA